LTLFGKNYKIELVLNVKERLWTEKISKDLIVTLENKKKSPIWKNSMENASTSVYLLKKWESLVLEAMEGEHNKNSPI